MPERGEDLKPNLRPVLENQKVAHLVPVGISSKQAHARREITATFNTMHALAQVDLSPVLTHGKDNSNHNILPQQLLKERKAKARRVKAKVKAERTKT